jgi:hypothetical protein
MASNSFESVYYGYGHSGCNPDEISVFEFGFKNSYDGRLFGRQKTRKKAAGEVPGGPG